jgi:uncharacterized protein
MPQHLFPGEYVEEAPSAIQAIAGVGTTTAGFIGKVPNQIELPIRIDREKFSPAQGDPNTFDLAHAPVATEQGTYEVRVRGQLDAGATLANAGGRATLTLALAHKGNAVVVNYLYRQSFTLPVEAGVPKLCTDFSDFREFFGDFSLNPAQDTLAHAVYGFFDNGGTRCYVVRTTDDLSIEAALTAFGAISAIAIVAAPGMTDDAVRRAIDAHCRVETQDRFAIFDCPENVVDDEGFLDLSQFDPSNPKNILPDNSDYAAFYVPWVEVFDPATKALFPGSNGRIFVPPSGHVAGIYARVEAQCGAFKPPANEVVLGALGLKCMISKAQQDGLNPQGVNCIRDLNDAIRVWGARTVGGDANGEWRYISVRRTMIYLRKSLDEGLYWVVFEPNSESLWAQVRRSIVDFLIRVWKSGALKGLTHDEAFFVTCDRTNMTQDDIDNGRLVCDIGVALIRPTEFVVFRISLKTADAPA